MPQMSPINWVSLMIFFSTTIFLFMLMNYYSTSYDNNKKVNNKEKNKINWKW